MVADISEVPQKRVGFLPVALDCMSFIGSCVSLWGIGYMGFSGSWVALGSLGYFMIRLARSRRARLTSSLKAIGENEKQFIFQNFSVRDLPSWVYFPDVERAEWLNKVLKRLWPYICNYATDLIRQTVAPAVAAQLPSALLPFDFLLLDLGDTPPRIGGVKVYMEESIRRDEVVLDLDLMLYSDARIRVQLGSIKAGVKEFELRGTLRVVMKPLVSKVPFAGAVTVCFLDSPYINFSLTDIGNILSLPGLQQTLSTVIRNVVDQLIVLPNRLPVQLLDNVDIQRLKYPMPQGVLRVNVVGARRLKVGDKNLITGGSSDPYCVIRVGARAFKTAVIQRTLEPEWNEQFEMVVDVWQGQSLGVEVYDKDQGNKDDYLGRTSVPLNSVHELGEMDTWTPLEEVKTGSIHLKLAWLTLSDNADNIPQAMEQALAYRTAFGVSMSSCFLYVVVEQAKNLRKKWRGKLTDRVKQMREPSPFCNLLLGREAQKTESKAYTQSPTWDSVHHFLVGDPYVDILQLIIRDARGEGLLGRCAIPVKILLSEQNMSVSRPFTLDEAGPEGATIYLHLELKALVPRPKVDPVTCPDLVQYSELEDTTEQTNPGSELEVPEANTDDPATSGDTVLRQRTKSPDQPTPDQIQVELNKSWQQKSTPELSPELRKRQVSASPEPPDGVQLGKIKLTVEYRAASSLLSVTVHEASNLRGVDKDGLADPYVVISLVDNTGQLWGEKKKTSPVKNNLNPIYEASYDFNVGVHELPTHGLRVDVRNHVSLFTRSGRTHQMGSVYIDLCSLVATEVVSDWFPLIPAHSILLCDHHHNHSASE
uniref:Extended synaptotagmin n=1 Tax=Cryptocotyle lingua TaxID=66766 RepID=A0A7U0YES3_9TREM|nr:extended synaptotagmin [Cryptocotyle lingua]